MTKPKIPEAFIELMKRITNKRAKVVIDHILEHGFITTEDLEKTYGYNHPPRAARDVREAGIPLVTFSIKSNNGERNIAAYKFGDFDNVKEERIKGRLNWPKNFKDELLEKYGSQCAISGALLEYRYLQIDHRIPYEVVGDIGSTNNLEDFMLVSGSSNRAKSWSCENCQNWISIKDASVCKSCYWAFPENYSHIAMKPFRRLDIVWQEDEVADYDFHKQVSNEKGIAMPEYVKSILTKIRLKK